MVNGSHVPGHGSSKSQILVGIRATLPAVNCWWWNCGNVASCNFEPQSDSLGCEAHSILADRRQVRTLEESPRATRGRDQKERSAPRRINDLGTGGLALRRASLPPFTCTSRSRSEAKLVITRDESRQDRQNGLSFGSGFLVFPSKGDEPVLTPRKGIVYVTLPQITSPRRFVVPDPAAPPIPQATATFRTIFHTASQG